MISLRMDTAKLALYMSISYSLSCASQFSISGKIQDIDQQPKSGVVVRITSSGDSAISNSNGEWAIGSASSIVTQGKAQSQNSPRVLKIENGSIRLSFNGSTISGAKSNNAHILTHSNDAQSAKRLNSSIDTLSYSYNGHTFLRDTISSSRSDIFAIYDTTWNPDVIYGWIIDSRDGKRYRTVKISSQTWMAQNLDYSTDSSWCYNDSAVYCKQFGRLYQWASALAISNEFNAKIWTDSTIDQGVCPTGWRIPSYSEWQKLTDTIVGRKTAGFVLKSKYSPSKTENTDAFGFRVLLAGGRGSDGNFNLIGKNVNYYTKSQYSVVKSYSVGFSEADMAWPYYFNKLEAYALRCLMK